MSEKEGKILAIYDKSAPDIADLFESSTINHWAWSGLIIAIGFACWLAIALVTAENERYALVTGKCQDPVFEGAVDMRCLETVHSREHWWEHLYAALVRPKSK
jgi:hypothetical protein